MTVLLVLTGRHLKIWGTMQRVRKQAEEPGLTCLFIDRLLSSRMVKLGGVSAGAGGGLSSASHHASFPGEMLVPKMRTSFLSEFSLRQLFLIQSE